MENRHIRKLPAIALAAALAASAAGCGQAGDGDEAPVKELSEYTETEEGSGEEREPFMEYVSGSGYEYLYLYALNGDGFVIDVYMPGADAKETGEASCEGTAHGITVGYSLPASGGLLYDEVGKAYNAKMTELSSDMSVSDITVPEMLEGDGWLLQEIDYTVETAEAVYPCRAYVKGDDLGGGAAIVTVITVDNTEADAMTADVLAEVLDVSGITEEAPAEEAGTDPGLLEETDEDSPEEAEGDSVEEAGEEDPVSGEGTGAKAAGSAL